MEAFNVGTCENGSYYTCVLVALQQIFVDAAEFGDLDLIFRILKGIQSSYGCEAQDMYAKAWAIALMETRLPQTPKVTAASLCPTIHLIKKSCPSPASPIYHCVVEAME